MLEAHVSVIPGAGGFPRRFPRMRNEPTNDASDATWCKRLLTPDMHWYAVTSAVTLYEAIMEFSNVG